MAKQNFGVSLAERRRKQSIGNVLFGIYLVVFAIFIKLSFDGSLPKFDFETQPYNILATSSSMMRKNFQIPLIACAVYFVTIFSIKAYMKSREPFHIDNLLSVWSLFLTIFSFLGAIRTIPELVRLISTHGFFGFICSDSRQSWVFDEESSLNTWIFYFCLSKFFELGDTYFIVFKKNKLIFLHWYHHITVLLFCWHCYASMSLYGSIFCVLNFTVHTIMYGFYTLAALKYKPKMFSQMITLSQILQMVIGIVVTVYSLYHMTFIAPMDVLSYFREEEKFVNPSYQFMKSFDETAGCKNNPASVVMGLGMYASYFVLFLIFFVTTYMGKKDKMKKN